MMVHVCKYVHVDSLNFYTIYIYCICIYYYILFFDPKEFPLTSFRRNLQWPWVRTFCSPPFTVKNASPAATLRVRNFCTFPCGIRTRSPVFSARSRRWALRRKDSREGSEGSASSRRTVKPFLGREKLAIWRANKSEMKFSTCWWPRNEVMKNQKRWSTWLQAQGLATWTCQLSQLMRMVGSRHTEPKGLIYLNMNVLL